MKKGGVKREFGIVTTMVSDGSYGFIMGEDGIERFFHASMVEGDFDDLHIGDRVSYVPLVSIKGPRASAVREEK